MSVDRERLQAWSVGDVTDTEADEIETLVTSTPDLQVRVDQLNVDSDPLVQALRRAIPVAQYSQEPELQQALREAAAVPLPPAEDLAPQTLVGSSLTSASSASIALAERLKPQSGANLSEPARSSSGLDHSALAVSLDASAQTWGTSPDVSVSPPGSASRSYTGLIRDYRLLELLGEGGMGAVYRAVHTRLDKVVAIKLLPPDTGGQENSLERFSREMKAIGRLHHPNIVAAYDAGEAEGIPYLVMEYVDGADLSRVVKLHKKLLLPDACEIIRQAALGLQHIHEHGLVHRDIKPSNLILVRPKPCVEPVVKLLDLGLALLAAAVGDLTQSGRFVGTLPYMAPEQADDPHQVDIRADVYGLGCTLYLLLAGSPPFPSTRYPSPASLIMAHATATPVPLRLHRSDIPPELDSIVSKTLAKLPTQRFLTPESFAKALEPFCEGHNLHSLFAVETSTFVSDSRPPIPPPDNASEETKDTPYRGTVSQSFPAEVVAAPPELPPPGRWKSRVIKALFAVVAVLGLAAGGLGYYHWTDRAELVVESPENAVPVTIRQPGWPDVSLTLIQGQNVVPLKSGHAEVLLEGKAAGVYSVDNATPVLRRGDRLAVKLVAGGKAVEIARNDPPRVRNDDPVSALPGATRSAAEPGGEPDPQRAPSETPPAESTPAEPKPAESKPAESKPAESKPADSKPAETPSTGKPVPEEKPGSAPPAEVKPVDLAGRGKGMAPATGEPKPGGSKPPEGEPKPGDSKPGDSKPGDSKPGDSKPGDAGGESKPGDKPKEMTPEEKAAAEAEQKKKAEMEAQAARDAEEARLLALKATFKSTLELAGTQIREHSLEEARETLAKLRTEEFKTLLEEQKKDFDSLQGYLDRTVIQQPTGMELVLVKGGTFSMGAPDSDSQAQPDEKPLHEVQISRSLLVGRFEVTRGQFARFVAAKNYQTEAERSEGGRGFNEATGRIEGRRPQFTWKTPGWEPYTDDHPVVNVTWNDAAAFCNWLSELDKLTPCYQISGGEATPINGRGYRLPTEAEWEYLCRAGTTTRYSCGDDPQLLTTVGNVADVTGASKFADWQGVSKSDGFVFTAPVGKFAANAFDLHDLHGNVWEWVNDAYDPEFYRRSRGPDPRGPVSRDDFRVVRGGSFGFAATHCRSANRLKSAPETRDLDLGFRVVRPAP